MKISIQARDVTGEYILREHVGDGHCDGYEFSVANTMSGGLIVEIDNQVLSVRSRDIVQEIVAAIVKRKRGNELA